MVFRKSKKTDTEKVRIKKEVGGRIKKVESSNSDETINIWKDVKKFLLNFSLLCPIKIYNTIRYTK